MSVGWQALVERFSAGWSGELSRTNSVRSRRWLLRWTPGLVDTART